jgi:phage terminase small subunit
MTPKECRFVREYLIDLNATAAARRAGYSAASARSIGPRLLKRPELRDALAAARRALAERTAVTPERVVAELARVAFASKDDYLDWGPDGVTLRDKALLNSDQCAAIADIGHNGKTPRLKLYDKLAALDKLARHLDLYGEARADALAKREHRQLSDTERLQRLLGLVERVRKQWEQEVRARGETPPEMPPGVAAYIHRFLP